MLNCNIFYVLLGSVQFLALLSAPCYHKMAVKEMTPSLALLFLKLAGTTLQILGPKLSKKYNHLPGPFLSTLLEPFGFTDSGKAQKCNYLKIVLWYYM